MNAVISSFRRRHRKWRAFRPNTPLLNFAMLFRLAAEFKQPGFTGIVRRAFSLRVDQRIHTHRRPLLFPVLPGEVAKASSAPASNKPDPIAEAFQPSRR